MQSFLKSVLSSLLGGGLAFVLAILCRDYQVKRAVPAIFVVVLVLIAQLAGRMASLLTALVGGLIFAVHLFEPYGNLAVGSAADSNDIVLLRFGRLGACLPISSSETQRADAVWSRGIDRAERTLDCSRDCCTLLADRCYRAFSFRLSCHLATGRRTQDGSTMPGEGSSQPFWPPGGRVRPPTFQGALPWCPQSYCG